MIDADGHDIGHFPTKLTVPCALIYFGPLLCFFWLGAWWKAASIITVWYRSLEIDWLSSESLWHCVSVIDLDLGNACDHDRGKLAPVLFC
jgi:hypothetical protein